MSAQAATEPGVSASCIGAPKTVLVVDDDAVFGATLVDGLTTIYPDLSVYRAENGKEASAIMKNVAVDLVITDLRMPSMGGLELTLWVNELWPCTPVIVLSAYANTDTINDITAQGNYFFDKPVDFGDLSRTVGTLLETGSHSRRLMCPGSA
jgi:DNA-binding NtrC family response regulator